MPPEKREQRRPSPPRASRERTSRPPSRGGYGERGTENALEAIVGIILLLVMLSWLLGFLGGNPFKKITAPFVPITSFEQVKTPIGGDISLGEDSEVFASPGGSSLGFQFRGAEGKVAGGPEYFSGQRYWFVDFENGPDGWVSEDTLRNATGGRFDPGDTPVGSGVQTPRETSVLGSPGGSSIGAQQKGARGTVAKGPLYANGQRYWFVDFENGPDGWVSEKNLLNARGGLFNAGTTPVGRRISVSADPANILNEPGGLRIGSQERGASGVVTEGPRYANGQRYWYVDFDSGSDGWVDEKELQLLKAENFFTRSVSFFVGSFKLVSTLLSLLFLSGIVYSVIRLNQITAKRRKTEHQRESPAYAAAVAKERVNTRWERVIAHVQSENASDWRLAILESDIMLAELLERMGYAGENVGEKLKTIEQSDFNTIEDAWEAHKVRNLIAHQGSDYLLSKREAQRVVSLYANVFREFRYI